MSRFIRILALSAVALLGSSAALIAKPVRFVPMNQEIAALNLSVRDSKGTQPIKDLNPGKRSSSYDCVTDEPPLVLVLVNDQDPEAKPESVAIPLTAEMKSPLVVILPDPDHPSGLRTVAVDEGKGGFPWGALRFLNTTDLSLMLRYGTDEVKPLAAANSTLDVASAGDARNVGIQLFKEENENEILYSAVWQHDPNIRKLVVLVAGADPTTRPLELVIIPEDQRSQ